MTAIDGLLARIAAAMSVEVRPWAERVTAPPAVTSNAKVTRDRSRPTPPRLSRLFLSLASERPAALKASESFRADETAFIAAAASCAMKCASGCQNPHTPSPLTVVVSVSKL